MVGMTYMQRRPSGIYEFRKRLPQEIAGKPAPTRIRGELAELINAKTGNFKQFLTISLNTTDQKRAKQEDLRQAARVADLYEKALRLLQAKAESKGTAVSPELPPMQQIEDHFYQTVLADYEKLRRHGDARRQMQSPEERSRYRLLESVKFGGLGLSESHMVVLDEEIALLLADFRNALARYDITIARAPLLAHLADLGLSVRERDIFKTLAWQSSGVT